jgi:hypothetical protein
MNPETGVMNLKTLKVVSKPLVVKISTVSKDRETGMIKVQKRDEQINQITSLLDILYINDKKY